MCARARARARVCVTERERESVCVCVCVCVCTCVCVLVCDNKFIRESPLNDPNDKCLHTIYNNKMTINVQLTSGFFLYQMNDTFMFFQYIKLTKLWAIRSSVCIEFCINSKYLLPNSSHVSSATQVQQLHKLRKHYHIFPLRLFQIVCDQPVNNRKYVCFLVCFSIQTNVHQRTRK